MREKKLKNNEKAAVDDKENIPSPSLSQLFQLARPEYFGIFIAIIFMVISEATTLIVPIVLANAYDAVINPTLTSSERMSTVNYNMLWVIILHFGGSFLSFVRTALLQIAGERVVARLRIKLYSKILSQEISFFDETKSGELVSRLGSDTALIQSATSRALPDILLSIVKMIVSIVLMFWISPIMSGLTLAMTFFLFLCCVPFGKLLGEQSKRYQNVLGEAQTSSTEALGGVRTVQAFTAEQREVKRYSDNIGDPDLFPWWWPQTSKTKSQESKEDMKQNKYSNDTTYKVGVFKAMTNSSFFTIIFGGGFGSLHIVLWYGFKLVVDETLTLGLLTAFNSYVFQIGFGLGQASGAFTQIIEAKGASARIFQLLNRTPQIPTPIVEQKDKKVEKNDDPELGHGSKQNVIPTKPELSGRIVLNNVSFAYPSRPDLPVLQNINLTIPENTTAAFVGSSGGGKSTIVSLLQRFYDVSEGQITIDGNDIRNLDLKYLRQHFGYVQQEPQLFGLTIRENLCYGLDRMVSDDELGTVCKEANALDFILQWPSGYDTLIGERGIKLSGGQKQRLAIARALLVNPRILLLDEATSALDSESEHLVQEAINKVVVGRTVVVIAHRLSTIKDSAQIVVLDDHKIVDVGTHNELLGRCKKYQELIKRQTAA